MILSDELADQIATLLLNGKVILFAGAGLSLQAINKLNPHKKLPLWHRLSEIIAADFCEYFGRYEGDLFDL